MRCLVSGEATTDKINTSLIAIYKQIEKNEELSVKLEKKYEELESALEKINKRIDNLVEKNGLAE